MKHLPLLVIESIINIKKILLQWFTEGFDKKSAIGAIM